MIESPSLESLETIGLPVVFNDAILIEWPDRLEYSGIPVPQTRLEVDISVMNRKGSSDWLRTYSPNLNLLRHKKECFNFMEREVCYVY